MTPKILELTTATGDIAVWIEHNTAPDEHRRAYRLHVHSPYRRYNGDFPFADLEGALDYARWKFAWLTGCPR